jgi:hypothetical protein
MTSRSCGVCGTSLPRTATGRHCPPVARRATQSLNGELYARWRALVRTGSFTQAQAARELGVTYAALVQSIRRGRAREDRRPARRLRSSSEGAGW